MRSHGLTNGFYWLRTEIWWVNNIGLSCVYVLEIVWINMIHIIDNSLGNFIQKQLAKKKFEWFFECYLCMNVAPDARTFTNDTKKVHILVFFFVKKHCSIVVYEKIMHIFVPSNRLCLYSACVKHATLVENSLNSYIK